MRNPFLHWQRKRQRQIDLEKKINNINYGIESIFQIIGYASKERKWYLCDRLGFKLLLDKNSLVDNTVLTENFWEKEQIEYLTKIYSDSSDRWDVFVDVGAYWGLYSLIFNRLGIETVIAFEPDRYNYSQFRTQLMLNNLLGFIDLRNYALGDKNQTVYFSDSAALPDGNRGGSRIVLQPNTNTYQVESKRGDDVLGLKNQNIIMKLDIEGHEANALYGMEETIKNNNVFIQVESFENTEKATLAAAKELGLRLINKIHVDHYFTNMNSF